VSSILLFLVHVEIKHFLLSVDGFRFFQVDGQNVIGLKDKEIATIIEKAPSVVTVTVIPTFVYNHMMKK
jgi:hypothetical protein